MVKVSILRSYREFNLVNLNTVGNNRLIYVVFRILFVICFRELWSLLCRFVRVCSFVVDCFVFFARFCV